MEEKDRWAVQIEYLKLVIALSTAIVGAAAAIYVDDAKIPADSSRITLLWGVASFFIVLIASASSLGFLSNHMVYFTVPSAPAAPTTAVPVTTAPATTPAVVTAPATTVPATTAPAPVAGAPAPLNRYTRAALILANISFTALCAGAVFFSYFFLSKSNSASTPSFDRAIALGKHSLSLNAAANETAALKSLELQGDSYVMTYAISPAGGIASVTVDSNGTRVKSLKKP